MYTNLFNPFRVFLREEAPENVTPPGEQNPAPTPAEPPAPAPGNDTSAPGEGEDANFNLDSDPGPDTKPGDGDKPQEENPDDGGEYVLELPEDFQASDDFKTLATEQAKAAGLDGKVAGQYVSGVIAALQKAETEAIAQSTKELKAVWGTNFNANMGAVKQFTAKLRTKAGLTAEDMAPLQSPKGFKLLHALMTATGEDTFVGAKNAAPGRSNAEEAHAMLTDPNHPDYAALDDPTHHRHMEANRKYNRLVGLV